MTHHNVCTMCGGNGKCQTCNGTGVNVHLNESEPKCQNCGGTGTCAECQGTGRWYVRPPDLVDPGLNKL